MDRKTETKLLWSVVILLGTLWAVGTIVSEYSDTTEYCVERCGVMQ